MNKQMMIVLLGIMAAAQAEPGVPKERWMAYMEKDAQKQGKTFDRKWGERRFSELDRNGNGILDPSERPKKAAATKTAQTPAVAAHPTPDTRHPTLVRPNILWIVTDDQRADSLACYNRAKYGTDESPLGYVESPNIDALAKEGVLFTRAICNAPVCGPSRGSMHTGRYTFHNGHYAFETTHQEPDFVKPVVHQIIRKVGYSTAAIGKNDSYIYNYPGNTYNDDGIFGTKIHFKHDIQANDLGDIFSSVAGKEINGKYTVYGKYEKVMYPDGTIRKYLVQNHLEPLTPKEIAEKKRTDEEFGLLRSYSLGNKSLIYGGRNPQPANKTCDAWIARVFMNYLSNADKTYTTCYGATMQGVPSDKPCMVDLGFRFPHTPILAPQSFRDHFADKVYRVPDFAARDLKKLPAQLKSISDQMRILPRSPEDVDTKRAFSPADVQKAIRDYYAFCAHGDELIGEVVKAFREYSVRQGRDYLIVYTVGDHGWHLGEQGIEAKFSPWGHSVNGAAIVVSSDKKRFPAGTVCDDLVEYVDFVPTILAAGGVDIHAPEFAYLDGFDLAEVLQGKVRRDYALGEINVVCGPRAYLRSKEFAFSMRTRKGWGLPKEGDLCKGVKWPLECPVEQAELALYDLRVDPHERNNVAADPEYAALAQWFREKLGNIVLGDDRVECDWSKKNVYKISSFARGSDDKKLNIPAGLVPAVKGVE